MALHCYLSTYGVYRQLLKKLLTLSITNDMMESSLNCFSNKVQPWVRCVWNQDPINDVLKALQR